MFTKHFLQNLKFMEVKTATKMNTIKTDTHKRNHKMLLRDPPQQNWNSQILINGDFICYTQTFIHIGGQTGVRETVAIQTQMLDLGVG